MKKVPLHRGSAPDAEVRFPSPDLKLAVERILERWRAGEGDAEGHESELETQLFQVADDVAAAERRVAAARQVEAAEEALADPEDASRGREEARAGEGMESPLTADPDPAGAEPGPPPRGESGREGVVLRRRLLELLRSELVVLWSERGAHRPDPRRMIRTLRALDDVQARLVPRWDREFGVSLEGPSGLELAVEIAHDFRSPLSSILFLADTLRSGGSGEMNELQRRQLNLVYSAALSMISMAGDVVDLGRDGQPMAEREPVRFSVSEVMDSVRGMVEPMAEAKSLTLSFRHPDGDLRLGYPEALRRTLLNLTTNAVKFTSDGFVEVSARSRGRTGVLFSVRDTGPGISSGAQERLYQPFRPFQGHSGFHFSGTGLGLTIARKLVHAMEGELHYETQAGLGTRFYFTIPLQSVDPL